MTTIAFTNSADAVPQSVTLRAELKEWERAFAAANGGKKADRNDIKRDSTIAAKYKEYTRLKSVESSSTNGEDESHSKTSKHTRPDQRSKKRKHTSPTGPAQAEEATPRKAAKNTFLTPSINRIAKPHPAELDPYDSPSTLRKLFSPSTHQTPLKAAIGPTPQRDGKTLGLFDLLSESGGSSATPSANRTAIVEGAAAQTPSKRKALDSIAEEEETGRPERTPVSSGKRFMLSNLFATPMTLRYAAMADGGDNSNAIQNSTPVNSSKPDGAVSGTPSFLRRSSSGRYLGAAANAGFSPTAVRKPQQFVGRGLSTLVQGLRDIQEERLEEDMDVLREIEAEQAANEVEVNDNQAPDNNDTAPKFKKKGQKRTTRRVRMKPVVVQKPQTQRPEPDEEDGSDDGLAAVLETQHRDAVLEGRGVDSHSIDIDDAASLHTASEPDHDSDPDFEHDAEVGSTKGKSFSEKMKEAISSVAKPHSKQREEKKSRPEPVAKEESRAKPARKVNPDAHANYRSLKIRNKNTKGRFGGRFRRR